MTKKTKEQLTNYGATALGVLVAVANAWFTIDWDHFEWSQNNIVKLSLSGIIAAGGYLSKFRTSKKSDIDQQN